MLPSQALQNFNPGGSTHQGLVDDISTRSLQSVRVGEGAGKISTGISMAFVGYEAGKYHQSGSFGTFVGFQAGFQNTAASYGTFVGAFAGALNDRGEDNTFVGFRAGEQNTSGSECVAAGAYAMRYNASGNYSVAVGYAAAERSIDGNFNTMIGAQSGQDNRSGSYNTMAGYRSGRSAFQGNYNTYFGAFAGYSNYHGDANCFIGYKSGESLSDGSLNIAIGAYSMSLASQGDSNIAIGPYAAYFATGSGNVYFGQNAGASNFTGDFNVIVGVNAGLSNIGNKNVIIGESSAPVWRGDCNVLIGAEVAPEGSGFQNVIIGYNAASGNYRAGKNNIFIGDGTDATQSNVNNAISIGTVNVITTSDSVAIGKDIENTGINSVSVGFSISTNAQNSVLVGETLTITSATYFNDPLNIQTVAIIQSDAYLKFGISNILYTNGILGTQENPYATAEFGYATSNLYSTTTAPLTYPLSPSQYDLQNVMGYYALTQGCNLFYTHPDCNITDPAFLQTVAALTASNIRISSGASFPVITTDSNAPLATYASNQTDFYSTMQFTNVGIGTTFIHNVFSVNAFTIPYTLSIPKNHVKPYISTEGGGIRFAMEPPGAAGIFLEPSESNYIVLQPPRYGTLSTCLTAEPAFPDYTYTTPHLFVSNDVYAVLPSAYYYDATSNLYGISSNATAFFTCNQPIVAAATPTVMTPRPFAIERATPTASLRLPLTRHELVYVHYGTWAYSSNVAFAGFDSNFLFSNIDTQRSYTCNEALVVPDFPPATVSFAVDVDWNTSNFIFAESNASLYIGHTYIFQQFSSSNTDLPLRFASAADGAGGTDYTCNVVFAGTPGIDGTSTILITADTPNPLYYYASNQVNYGSSNAILPVPTAPLTVSYDSVLLGSNFFYLHPQSNLPTTAEPLHLVADGSNHTIPFVFYQASNATQPGLWDSPDAPATLFASNYTLSSPMDTLTFPWVSNVDYAFGFVEQAPAFGRLSTVTAGSTACNAYLPLDPWNLHQDTVSFFVADAQHHYKRSTWNLTTTPGTTLYQNSNYWIQVPTQTTLLSSAPSFIETTLSNSAIFHEITYTCNLLPLRTVYVPITSYDPTVIGQEIIHSNELQQSNVIVFPGAGSNYIIVIEDTSNIDISFTNESNITTASNIVSNEAIGYDTPHSNLVITFFQTNTTIHRRLYDSNYDVFRQWVDASNVYDGIRDTYLYTYASNTPYGLSNLVSSNELTTGASSQTYTYNHSNIVRSFKETHAFHPLSRTTLYQSNAIFITDPESQYRAVVSNVGPVGQFTTDLLVQQRVYLEPIPGTLTTPLALPLTSLPSYRFSVQTNPGGEMIATGAIGLGYFTSNVATLTLQELPDYASRSPEQWWQMNSNAQASLGDWETTMRPTLGLTFTPTHLYLPKLRYGSFIDADARRWTHRVSLNALASPSAFYYQASGLYDREVAEFFYANETTGQVSPLYRQSILLRFPPSSPSLYAISSQLARRNPFSSNALYVSVPEAPATNLYYRFDIKNPSDPMDIYQWPSKTSQAQGIYSWSNLASGLLYMTLKNAAVAQPFSLSSNVLPYTVYASAIDASTGLNVLDSGSMTVPVVPFYDFPDLSGANANATLESIRFLQLPHCNVFYGTASNALFNYVDAGGTFQLDTVAFLTEPPVGGGGFLSNAWFSYSNVSENTLSYLPYDASVVSNETIPYRWLYRNIASPPYLLDYKNYWFQSGPQPIEPQHSYAPGRQVFLNDPSRFYPSQGWLADGLSVLPSVYTYSYDSNARDNRIESFSLVTGGTTLASTLTFTPVAYSYPPVLLTETLAIPVEQASGFSLKALVHPAVVSWDSNHANELRMYIDQRPSKGVIVSTLANSNVSSWSYTELLTDAVAYQHLGNSASTDQFSVRYATHPYHLSPPLTIQLTIEPLPRVSYHRQDAIYALSSNEALAAHYSLRNSLTFETPVPSAAYMEVLATCNVYTVFSDTPCNVLPLAYMASDSNVYRMTADYFTQTSYEPLSLRFAVRSRPTGSVAPHRLTYEPMYSNLIVHDWSGEFNHFTSCNALVPPFLASNEQKVEYQFIVQDSNYQDMTDLETSFSFYTQPNTAFFPYASVASPRQNSNALVLFDPYLDFAFSIQFLNSNTQTLCSLDVSRSSLTVNLPTGSNDYPIPAALKNTIAFNDYTYWSLIFNDSANQGGLSFYINPNTLLPNKDNQARNVLSEVLLTPSLNTLSTVRIVSQADHPKNFYASHTCNLRPPDRDVGADVFLSNYNHRLFFKNVELSTKLPSDASTEAYNIALGKNIQIKGEDNICFGTNFSTLGKYSIIIGNNIGQSANFVNQIYESIIIGNTSFQGSVIRNVVAIGSQLMNNLFAGALPGLTDQVINQFISKKPILIGNDIGPEKVDYHVNIANTVMRTSIGNTSNLDQIYLGNASEVVAVGYTSNAYLQGPAQLFVQGDIQADAIQYHFAESPDYGTEETPVNGGSFIMDCDQVSRVIFELSSNVPSATPLSLSFINLSRHIGKELDIVFNERSSVARSLTISGNIRFANPRPTQLPVGALSRLQCLIVQSNVALGTWTGDAAAY